MAGDKDKELESEGKISSEVEKMDAITSEPTPSIKDSESSGVTPSDAKEKNAKETESDKENASSGMDGVSQESTTKEHSTEEGSKSSDEPKDTNEKQSSENDNSSPKDEEAKNANDSPDGTPDTTEEKASPEQSTGITKLGTNGECENTGGEKPNDSKDKQAESSPSKLSDSGTATVTTEPRAIHVTTPIVIESQSSSRSEASTPTPTDNPAQPGTKDQANKISKVTQMLETTSSTEDYRPIAQLTYEIGIDLVKENVFRDLLRIQKKKEDKGMLDEREKSQKEKLSKAHAELEGKNIPFTHKFRSCEYCGFKTDSDNIMEWHLDFAHDIHLGLYTCALCEYKGSKNVTFFMQGHHHVSHLDNEHNRRGRIFSKPSFYVCPNCPFENNNGNNFSKHMERCNSGFNTKANLAPAPPDKDVFIAVPRAAPSKAASKVTAKPSTPTPVRPTAPAQPRPGTSVVRFPTPAQTASKPSVQTGGQNSAYTSLIQKAASEAARKIMAANRPTAPSPKPILQPVVPSVASPGGPASAQPKILHSPSGNTLIQMNGMLYKLAMVGTQQFLVPVSESGVATAGTTTSPTAGNSSPRAGTAMMTSVRPQPPKQPAPNRPHEQCEICGGFVRDLEALRIHFIWAHKVNIHPDVFKKNKPPLNCTACKNTSRDGIKFWTIQGLTKHQLDCHQQRRKLIDEISKNCVYCLEKFKDTITAAQFWTHMAIHGMTPSSVFRTNKCVACGCRLNDMNLIKAHMQLKHGLLLDGQKTQEGPKPPTASPFRSDYCYMDCGWCSFRTDKEDVMKRHINSEHGFKCTRCPVRFDSAEVRQTHFNKVHSESVEKCHMCATKVKVGRLMIRHIRSTHLKDCSVVLPALSKKVLSERKREIDAILAQSLEAKKTTPSKRRRTASQRSSSQRRSLDERPGPASKKARNGEVLNVAGEKIVVEINDTEEEQNGLELKIASTTSLAPIDKLTNGLTKDQPQPVDKESTSKGESYSQPTTDDATESPVKGTKTVPNGVKERVKTRGAKQDQADTEAMDTSA